MKKKKKKKWEVKGLDKVFVGGVLGIWEWFVRGKVKVLGRDLGAKIWKRAPFTERDTEMENG